MTDSMKGQVKSLVNDKKTGRVTGLSLQGVQAFFDYSLPAFRGQPFDEAEVGGVVELGVTQKDQPANNGWPRYWVKTILRCDEDSDEPPWLMEEDGPGHTAIKEKKAAVVKEVLAGEQGRNQSIERQVAMKCAAEVVAAVCAHGRPSDESLATLIDLCLDKFLAATK